MDLSDRVLRSTLRTEAIRTWLEVRLEDRLEHQLQRGLHDPVRGRRDPQRTDLAAHFGDRLLPHPTRNQPASLEIVLQPVEQFPDTGHNRAGCHPIDAGGSCAHVAPHPTPRHNEERRVVHEVEQVIEATVRIGRRPLVQLRLHHEYPHLGHHRLGPRRADVHRRPPRATLMLRTHWTPSPCARLSRARTTTGPPSHPDRISRRRAFPPTSWLLAGKGTVGVVPTFTLGPFDGIGAQLCPCNIATATPQTFTVASGPATSPSPKVPRPNTRVRAATQP
jgi:hypothetical protein